MKKVRNGNGDNQELNIIANGTSITGDITSGGDFRIEGSVKGKIETKGRIVVGESGVVVGELACTNADIMGNVKGVLKVTNLTILKSTAVFEGDVDTKKISIETGAKFIGNCTMISQQSKQSM
ncbi:MAG: polymer-forming cytoskeletal protein [Lentimicrobiaceae bacterium]|mgnify:FL=1|nr:polymer-forming cytoskeletal protein [Lentimicrobiaceae bacterium]MCP4909401.1 polymer-forming cytoskeletal protein [Bacteroidota bacterium]MBT3455106.1 polymer-forming cytoskeletal protein [Lentimicrobiaceae bacterium]MBT3817997.1 polymer-forming cytoskeletal protein [Lentimicrobiaceae bacterium]MBT4062375.1 polymer-forming cytoskeletal protein [Lentimicrobiaceae bacterium]